MSVFFQRHNFLWAGLTTPFIVESKIDSAQITLRTWRLSEDAAIASVMPANEAAEIYGGHAEPFEIDSDLAPAREIREKHWIPIEALGGSYAGGSRHRNLFLQPISQVGFRIEPDVLGSAAWSDYAIWAFNSTRDGRLSMPFNRYLVTQPSRQHRHMLLVSRREVNLLTLSVPFARSDFSNCVFVLKYNPAFGCIHNFPDYRIMPTTKIGLGPYDLDHLYGFKALFASLRLSGPDTVQAGQQASYSIEMYSKNVDALVDDVEARVYLESSAGYLPQRQVDIRNGTGSFALMALGLSAGDRIKLKLGWRNFSGATEKIITVI